MFYIWQCLKERVEKIEKRQISIISEEKVDIKIKSAESRLAKEHMELKNSVDRLVDKMDARHERLEKIEEKFEDFLTHRSEIHNQINRLINVIWTQDQIKEVITKLDKIDKLSIKDK